MLKWNYKNHIEPINKKDPTDIYDRSPYKFSLLDFYKTFSSTKERKELVKGLALYRQKLYRLNLKNGIQWIDGSFVENIEKIQNRPPNDIDVFTFLFENEQTINNIKIGYSMEFYNLVGIEAKNNFGIDGYIFPCSEVSLEELIFTTCYWYGMWSHTREHDWKGFIQINLDCEDDQNFYEYLKECNE